MSDLNLIPTTEVTVNWLANNWGGTTDLGLIIITTVFGMLVLLPLLYMICSKISSSIAMYSYLAWLIVVSHIGLSIAQVIDHGLIPVVYVI
jgi:hypothetical protein